MAKTDTKVKKGLNKYSLLFSRPWNGLVSTGTGTKWNHAHNFEPKSKYLQQSFQTYGILKGLVKHLKLLKGKIPTCNLPLFLILQTYMHYHCPKSTEMTSFSMILWQSTFYVLVCQYEQFYCLQYPPTEMAHIRLWAWKTRWLYCMPPPPPRSK